MLYPDYGVRALFSLLGDLALATAVMITVPPVAFALGFLAAFDDSLPQPAGCGPKRRDEYN